MFSNQPFFMEIIAQGAEAILTKKGDILEKERISKGYRIQELDKPLREKRTKLEVRIMREARRAGVPTPQIFDKQTVTSKISLNKKQTREAEEVSNTKIKMQFIQGKIIRNMKNIPDNVAEMIGNNIAKLHRNNIIHGDLTTSNMILKDNKIWIIDFGLAFVSSKDEDKAVDLELLKQALESTHTNAETVWNKVLKAYSINYNQSAGVLQRLSALEKRGRYKRGKN